MGNEYSSGQGGAGGVNKSSDAENLNYVSKGPMSFSYASIAQHTNFTREEIEALHASFQKSLPADGSTTLTIDDFKKVLAASNIKNENQGFVNELFRAMDTNGDGVVNFVEICTGLSVMLKGTTKEKLALSFSIYDQDKSGKIKKTEMFEVLSKMNMTVKLASNSRGFNDAELMAFVSKLFKECDKDKDEVIGFSEFLTAVEKYPALVEFK